MFSERRLREFLENTGECAPDQLIRDLVSEVRRFTGDIPQSDDITVLGLRFLGTGGG